MPSALLTRAARALRGALLGFLLAFAVRLALLRRLREKYNQWYPGPPGSLLLGNYRELKQHGDALFPTPAFLQAMHERYGRIVRVWCGPLWTGVGSLALSFLDPVDGLELLEKAPHRAPRDVLDGPFAGRDVQALRASCDAAVATPEAARAAHRATVAAMTRATANWPNAAVDAEAELGVIVYDVLGEVLLKLPPAAASPLAARLRGLHLSVRQEAAAFAARWVAPFWSPAYREHLQVGLATGRRRLTRCGGWQAVQALRRVCAQVVEERVSAVRASPGSFAGDRSALTLLATDAGLDQAQAAAAVLGLMHGAYDATLAALVWGLFHLAKHPSAQAALQKELDGHIGRRLAPAFDELARLPYLHACVQESLRLKPSFPSIHRVNYGQDMFVGKPWSNEDDDFFGEAFVPRGTPVIASLSSAGKLSKYYGRYPGEFRPERFLGDEPANVTARHSWRPFGAGPRMCVGMLLGLSVVKAALAVLLQKFRVELENPSLELQGEPGPGGVLLPEADLKLVFIAREEERAL